MPRTPTVAGQLARLGFVEIGRSSRLCASENLAGIADNPDVLGALSDSADPDQALLNLDRVIASATDEGIRPELVSSLIGDADFRRQLTAVLGCSEALADHLVRHPDHFWVLCESRLTDAPPTTSEVIDDIRSSVQRRCEAGGTWLDGALELRISYRRRLLAIASRDLVGKSSYAEVTQELANLADAVLAACLDLAQRELPEGAVPCRLSIIALGKCGGQELNYVSDVDVVFVAEPGILPDGRFADESEALATATQLARGVMRAANEPTIEGAIWEVDAALRPEGKSGALVRTLASHVGYYERWAQTWEFQALLKARHSAGDAELGHAYVDAMMPFVWSAAARPGFVTDVQAMRRRVEANIPAAQSDRELKLGKGGLRDVEFSVQLLQLVHGRSDVMVRSSNTMKALESMATWGYVGREDASTLSNAYRFLRTMEHRLQLVRLHRTHTVPDDHQALRRLGRSMGFHTDAAAEVVAAWQKQKLAVRRLHEKLFYRPLLNAVAKLEPGDARLSQEAAIERLTALGYVDPAGALRHIEALSSGISRRAAIQRTLLPVLLGWFAEAPNPDAGLAAFRRVSEALGGTPWYLRLLRDDSETAERMAHVLSASKFATALLQRAPEGVALLSDLGDLQPRTLDELDTEMSATAERQEGADEAALAVRMVRGRELFRIAAGDINDLFNASQVGHALSDLADTTVEVTLAIATKSVQASLAGEMPARFAIIAMGRLGGREIGYSSDVDAMFVYEPIEGASDEAAARAATAVANELRRLLDLPSSDPPVEIDADLRPEGRSGALARTLKSYEAYYARWSSPWEAQALLRARPLAGDKEIGNAFVEMANRLRYPETGISDADVMEARRLKARIESERLPRGADPNLHVKLGRGGLSDVEWVAQLIQMRHAGQPEFAALRTTGTLETLLAARELDLLSSEDETALAEAWSLATRVRNATYMVTGRASDQVPTDFTVLTSVAFILGYPADRRASFTEDYLRVARHSRGVFERLFYGWTDNDDAPVSPD